MPARTFFDHGESVTFRMELKPASPVLEQKVDIIGAVARANGIPADEGNAADVRRVLTRLNVVGKVIDPIKVDRTVIFVSGDKFDSAQGELPFTVMEGVHLERVEALSDVANLECLLNENTGRIRFSLRGDLDASLQNFPDERHKCRVSFHLKMGDDQGVFKKDFIFAKKLEPKIAPSRITMRSKADGQWMGQFVLTDPIAGQATTYDVRIKTAGGDTLASMSEGSLDLNQAKLD